MSSRRAAAFLALAAALTWAAPPCAAQEPSLRERLVQRLDSLHPLVQEAMADRDRAVLRADSMARLQPAQPQDTVRVGPLLVVTYPSQASLAREVVQGVWDELGGGVTRSPGLEELTFFFNWSTETTPLNLQGKVYEISAPVWLPRSLLESNAREAIGSAIAQDVKGPLLAWTGQFNVRPPRHPDWVYRELVSTASRANRDCAEGDAGACWDALGLGDGPVLDLYTVEEAADLAAKIWSGDRLWFRYVGYKGTEGERCVDERTQGRYDNCLAFLAKHSRSIPTPLGYAARQSMVWIALERGGAGAFDRLVADTTASPAHALRAASGLSDDELARAWLEWVLANRPAVYSDMGSTGWVALLWFLFFGALGLRSTRWRSV
ncbi:MAG: hypothetical protein AMXMBFR53_24640 [Gemmatimonadota bacterium]